MSDLMHIQRQNLRFSFDATHDPVCWIDSGTVIEFETCDDAYARLASGENYNQVSRSMNPVTGPVAVRGAEPGDSLLIEILSIDVTRAWLVWIPGFGGLGDKTTEMQVRQAAVENGVLHLTDTLSVPLDPMIGCIGVAPKKGVGSTVAPVGKWGGNMDLRELRSGVSIALPVFHSGALLSLGDVHAAMGTGEPCCIAIEAAAKVKARITVQKRQTLMTPRLRLPGCTVCVGIGQKITQAQLMAIDQAYEVLTGTFGLSAIDAYAYAAARLELRFGGPSSPIALAVIPDPPNAEPAG